MDTSAAVLPIAAFIFPIILGMAGLGVDAGNWLATQRNLQTAADAAALAAAWELSKGDPSQIKVVALREAVNNGFVESATSSFTLNLTETDEEVPNITVEMTQETSLWFARYFMDATDIKTTAIAEVGEDAGGEFCILSLEEEDDAGLGTFGTVDIVAPGCGIAVNSSSASAMTLTGNVSIDVGAVQIHGNYSVKGGASTFEYDSLKTNASQVVDPYADWEVPVFDACSKNDIKNGMSISSSGTVTLNPGVYCGGLKISGNNNIVFNPGVYIFDGGDLDISGGGSILGEEVSFVLTSGGNGAYAGVDITGNREIILSAPLAGDEMEGVVFFQDRNAPTNGNNTNKITGTADLLLDGTAYFPSQELRFGGNAGVVSQLESPCSRIIARVVTLAGTPTLGNSCEGSAALDITGTNGEIQLIQ